MIEGDIIREMTVDTDKKYQENFEAAAKMICQLKQIYHHNKGHDEMDTPDMEEVFFV